jgi:DNA-binding transcriptional LysR family regulator
VDPARLAAIDLNQLVVLDVLLAERSVTRAAQRLGLSQPAVSNALARLRVSLGDPLLIRGAQGMTPTPRALALAPALRDALERVGDAVAGVASFDPAQTSRTFVLAATDYVQFVMLAALVERLQKIAPRVALRVLPIHARSPWHELESGAVDLTLTGRTGAPRTLHRRRLFGDRVVCILRAGHPRARGRADSALTLRRYLELGHVEALPHGGEGLADEALAKLGHARTLILTVPHFLVAPFIVLRSDHCFTLAERIARPMASMVPLRVLPLPFELPRVTIWGYWHERLHHDPAHQWLRKVVAETAARLE